MHPVTDRSISSRSKKKRKKATTTNEQKEHEAPDVPTPPAASTGSSVLSSLWGRFKPASDPSPAIAAAAAAPTPVPTTPASTSELIQLPPPAPTMSLAQKWKVFLEEHKGTTEASENRKPWPTAEAQPVPTKAIPSSSSSTSPASSTAASTTAIPLPSSSSSSSSSTISSPSIPLPSVPIAGAVTITLLNTYGDMSEVSGLVLCPGFARPFAPAAHKPHDPVPSHLHPEAVSPTLLPPVPTLEERKEALEAANAINEHEEKQSEKEVAEMNTTTTADSNADVNSSSVTPTAHTLPDTSTIPASTSIANKLITRLTKKPTTESFPPATAPPPPSSTTTVITPPPAPSAPSSSGWLSYFSRSSASNQHATTTALDSISNPHAAQAASNVPSIPVQHTFGDRDHEMDLRPSPLPRLKSPRRFRTATTKQPLLPAAENSQQRITTATNGANAGEMQTNTRRSNSLMHQLWFGGETSSSKSKSSAAAKSTVSSQQQQQQQHPNPENKRSAGETETKETNSSDGAPTNSSSAGAADATGLGSSIRRMASSALFWTLGPFPPAPLAQALAVEKAISTDTAAPPPPPPVEIVIPPVWTTLRRVVIIGVHGWSLMGGMLSDKPIMVSQKFCAMAQRALAVYCKERGMNLSQIQVCTIPLHGHGKVEQRVENYLHHQLPVYQPYLSTADAIFVIGHSQGCLVSVSVLHQLVLQGWVDPSKQHVSMQLMAGLHHGPFPDLLSDLYAATKELFSFCYVDSEVHRRYMQGLHYLMENRVKVICIGSVHDQAVPLYSSLLQAFPSNPNLIRALYIDYSTYQPDFPYALLSLVVYLMNSGIHGRGRISGGSPNALEDMKNEHAAAVYVEALVHISGWLRGGLLEKNGGAHSAVHRLTDCYNLAMEWSLSGRGVDTPIHVHSHSFAIWAPYFQESFTHTKMNRYMLTVRFRELFSLLPLTALNGTQELSRLYQLYVLWQPRTRQFKLLKDSFAPLFEIQLQKDVYAGSSKEKEKHDEQTSDKAESTEKAVIPTPSLSDLTSISLPPNLLLLLQPPRLSNLPASFPTSWQMHAETHAAPLIENPSDSPQVPAPPAPGRKNRRLRHVKENVDDQSPQPTAAISSSNDKPDKPPTDVNSKPTAIKPQQVTTNAASNPSGLANSTYFKLRAKI